MPEITQWGGGDTPDRLCDDVTDHLDDIFKAFDPAMQQVADEGGAVMVTVTTYDPLTGCSFARTVTKGNYHAIFGAVSLWVADQTSS